MGREVEVTGRLIRSRGGIGREGDRKCGTEQRLVMEREVTGSVVRSRGWVGRER